METYELKRAIKETITEFHEQGLPKYYERDIRIPEFKMINKVFTIVGPRRAGKTYLLYQIMNDMIKKGQDIREMLYINFENERISDIKKDQFHLILDSYNELYPNKKPVLFFDEIQNIDGWEQFVRRLQDQNYQIYVTGSNSKLLSKEIATTLRGRAYSIEVFPLSFKEFLLFKDVHLTNNWEYGKLKNKIKNLFDEYMRLSGYPEIVLENRLDIIDDYFKTVFYRDIIERYKIKNLKLMKLLMKYAIKNYAKEFSINKFHNFAKSVGHTSSTSVIHSYVNMLREVYFSFFMAPTHKGKKGLSYSKKNYIGDHGFINYYVMDKDFGRILENLVFLELRRRYKNVNYYRNGFECDFIVQDKVIQVTYALTEENRKREIIGLEKSIKRFGLPGEIITYDIEDEIKTGAGNIPLVPIWKWLLR